MSRIVVIGGTGYAGSRIVAEALARGHGVISVARSAPDVVLEGVEYLQASILDPGIRAHSFAGADVVVVAISPLGDMAGRLHEACRAIAVDAAAVGARVLIIGSHNARRPAPGSPRVVESADLPDAWRSLVEEVIGVYDELREHAPDTLRWVYVSPAALFGAQAHVADTGTYQASGEVTPEPPSAPSRISAADLALGVLDEIEHGTRNREILSLNA